MDLDPCSPQPRQLQPPSTSSYFGPESYGSREECRRYRETQIQEHEQKIYKYQSMLTARLKAKYFSNKALGEGKIFEAKTIVDGETILSSRWPCTSSFANPIKKNRDKDIHDRSSISSLVADSSAKNVSPSAAAETSAKNACSLATENNLTSGESEPSKKI